MRRQENLLWALLVPLLLMIGGIVTLALTASSGGDVAKQLAGEAIGLAMVILLGVMALFGVRANRQQRRRLLRALGRYGFDTRNVADHVPNAVLELLLRVSQNEANAAAGFREGKTPEQPLTTDSLRDLLGKPSDGTPTARFNSEGGFSLN